MITAKFKVSTPFDIKSKLMFVLPGEILEGTIHPGMFAKIPFNTDTAISLMISSIKFIREVSQERPALVIKCESEEEIDFLNILNVSNELILISDEYHNPAIEA